MRRAAMVLMTLAMGCGQALPEPYVVKDLRIIAMVAEPPEAQPGETVKLTVHFADPQNNDRAVKARFGKCPERTDSGGTFACAVDGADTPLAEGVAQAYSLDVLSFAMDYIVPANVLDGVSTLAQNYGYYDIVTARGDNGLRTIHGFKRVVVKPAPTVISGAALPKNNNPVLVGFRLKQADGELKSPADAAVLNRGTDYILVPDFDLTSLESYILIDYRGTPQPFVEEASFTWSCSPDCKISQQVSFAGDEVKVSFPTGGIAESRAVIHLVMRDGRGGEALFVAPFALAPRAD